MKLSRHSFQALGLCTLALSVACAATEAGHSLAHPLPGPGAVQDSPPLAESSVQAGALPAAQALPMLGEMLTGQVMLLSLLLTPLSQTPAQLPASPSRSN
jgi:hypothetical protein